MKDFDPDGKRSGRREVYLFHVLHALWHSDCHDVQKMCLRSLEEEIYPKESAEALQSDVPHLDENHKLAQDTIVTLLVAGQSDLAKRLIVEYVKHAIDAARHDYHKGSWKLEEEELEKLPSVIWKSKVVKFGMRFVIASRPAPLYSCDKSPLQCNGGLAAFFLRFAEDHEISECEAVLFTRSYSKELLRILRNTISLGLEVRKDHWEQYERLFLHVLKTKWRCFDQKGQKYVLDMVKLFQELPFEKHDVFGQILQPQALHVCQLVVGTERPIREQLELVG